MESYDFDKEIQDMLQQRSVSETYSPYSVDNQVHELVTQFYDDYCDRVGLFYDDSSEEMVPEAIMGFKDTNINELMRPKMFDQDLLTNLSLSMQTTLERFPELIRGSMRVRGRGLFLINDAVDSAMPVEFLVAGTLVGEIDHYSAQPAIPYEIFEIIQSGDNDYATENNINASDLPGPWLDLKNAIFFNPRGQVTAEYQSISVPLNYPTLTFAKPTVLK